MGKHVSNEPLLPNTKRAHAERFYERLDNLSQVPAGNGRHRKDVGPEGCHAYTLSGFKVYYCKVEDQHETHSHPIFGKWTGTMNDLDQYRKQFKRY